jgi:hypothetical protein
MVSARLLVFHSKQAREQLRRWLLLGHWKQEAGPAFGESRGSATTRVGALRMCRRGFRQAGVDIGVDRGMKVW